MRSRKGGCRDYGHGTFMTTVVKFHGYGHDIPMTTVMKFRDYGHEKTWLRSRDARLYDKNKIGGIHAKKRECAENPNILTSFVSDTDE